MQSLKSVQHILVSSVENKQGQPGVNLHRPTRPHVTAGLKCPPLTGASKYTSRKMVKPNTSDTVRCALARELASITGPTMAAAAAAAAVAAASPGAPLAASTARNASLRA